MCEIRWYCDAFLPLLVNCRIVTLRKIDSSSGNQYTNSPVFDISGRKVRFNILIYLSTPRQFAFAAEGMLGGPFRTFLMFGSWKILGFLKFVVYGKAWLTTFWRSETMGSGRNCLPIYRLASLWCLIHVLVHNHCARSPYPVFSPQTNCRICFFLLLRERLNKWVLAGWISNNFTPIIYIPQVSCIFNAEPILTDFGVSSSQNRHFHFLHLAIDAVDQIGIWLICGEE